MAKWSSRFLLLNVLRERVSSVYSSNPFERASWKIEKHLFDRFNCVRKVFEKTRLTRLETVRWIVAQPVKLFSNRWTAWVPNHRAWNICWFCSFWWIFLFFYFFQNLNKRFEIASSNESKTIIWIPVPLNSSRYVCIFLEMKWKKGKEIFFLSWEYFQYSEYSHIIHADGIQYPPK